ncbi:MAG: cysteine-rich VLP domain-containing protein [Oscillospiraceae bacterium]|nr:cysteine-rich VLP domain-containing protein [Oscillospiraceae bacterium]
MVLETTPSQARRVHRLVCKLCSNCNHGNCLLLDDGKEHTCVQLISWYSIYCKYFLTVVLPTEKELHQKILTQNKYVN